MKILISSKLLASKLKEIDFEKESVERVTLDKDELILITQTSKVNFHVRVLQFKASVKQEGRRWDWVKSLVSRVEEQPIVLHIFDNVVNVIFQY
jgi:hypothetical protein